MGLDLLRRRSLWQLARASAVLTEETAARGRLSLRPRPSRHHRGPLRSSATTSSRCRSAAARSRRWRSRTLWHRSVPSPRSARGLRQHARAGGGDRAPGSPSSALSRFRRRRRRASPATAVSTLRPGAGRGGTPRRRRTPRARASDPKDDHRRPCPSHPDPGRWLVRRAPNRSRSSPSRRLGRCARSASAWPKEAQAGRRPDRQLGNARLLLVLDAEPDQGPLLHRDTGPTRRRGKYRDPDPRCCVTWRTWVDAYNPDVVVYLAALAVDLRSGTRLASGRTSASCCSTATSRAGSAK